MTAEDFTFDHYDNAWSSGEVTLTGDCWLRVLLNERGRVAIRKSNTGEKPWPVVLMSPVNTEFEIRIYGEAKDKHILVHTTSKPIEASLVNL